jgi:hypothetical protein
MLAIIGTGEKGKEQHSNEASQNFAFEVNSSSLLLKQNQKNILD